MSLIESLKFIEGQNIDDSQFTEAEIAAEQALLVQYCEDKYKNLDFSPVSGLYDIIIRPMANLFLLAQKTITSYEDLRTIQGALASATKNEIIDEIFSNFLITRVAGSKARGQIKVEVSDVQYRQFISKDIPFISTSGINFYPLSDTNYSVDLSSDGDKRIYTSKANFGFFIVDVECEKSGHENNVKFGSPFSYAGGLYSAASITAMNNFSGGSETESNESIKNRIKTSLSARGTFSVAGTTQIIKDAFGEGTSVHVHGGFSEMMTRNRDEILGTKNGCYMDIYAKTSSFPQLLKYRVLSSKIETGSEYYSEYPNLFLARVPSSAMYGMYDVKDVSIYSTSNIIGSYEVVKKIRRIDESSVFRNRITSIKDCAYTGHAYMDVIFNPRLPDPSIVTLAVSCELMGLPYIGDIQKLLSHDGNQGVAMDILVSACVPCFISVHNVTVTVDKTSTITRSTIANKIVSYITEVNPVVDSIRVDQIVKIISSIPGVKKVDLPIMVSGKLYPPSDDFTPTEWSSLSALNIPESFSDKTGNSVVGLFCSSDAIEIKIRKA